jgi:hypothetical protein
VVYEATTSIPGFYGLSGLQAIVEALQEQIDRDFYPIYGHRWDLSIQPKVRAGNAGMIWLDNSDQADALAYHDVTADGLPMSKIFVLTTLKAGDDPSVSASHENLEALLDPDISQVFTNAQTNQIGAFEDCDAVEDTDYLIGQVKVSNFVLPAWFGILNPPAIPQSRFDFMGLCGKPYQLLSGGYMSYQDSDGNWTQVFASVRGAGKFTSALHPRALMRESGFKRRSG